MRTSRSLLAATVVVAGTTWPTGTLHAAGPDPAEVLFERGLAHFDAGRFDKACPAIEESLRLDARPGTLFTLAECEAKRGRLATALKRYDEYLSLHASLPPEKKQKQGTRERDSREARAALVTQVPEITATLPPSAPAGTVVTRNGVPVTEPVVSIRVDPGEQVFTTQAPGGPRTETRVTLGKGEKKSVVLEVKAAAGPVVVAPPPPPPLSPRPPPDRTRPSARRIGAFVSGGIGAAGVLVGAIAGGMALAKKSTVDANCGANVGAPKDPGACTHTGTTAGNALKTLGTTSTVGFVIGGAGLVTGVVLFATEPKATGMAVGWGRVW